MPQSNKAKTETPARSHCRLPKRVRRSWHLNSFLPNVEPKRPTSSQPTWVRLVPCLLASPPRTAPPEACVLAQARASGWVCG